MWLKFRNNKVEVELTLIVTRKQNCEQCCDAEDVPKTAQKPSMHQVFIDMLQVRILCPTPWEHRYIYVVQVPIKVTMLPLVWFPVTVILVAFHSCSCISFVPPAERQQSPSQTAQTLNHWRSVCRWCSETLCGLRLLGAVVTVPLDWLVTMW